MRLDPIPHKISARFVNLIFAIGLGACATSGEPRQYLVGKAIADIAVGNTAAYERGYNYYAPDGRKINVGEGGDVVLRRWWVNDDDQWCETLVRDGREFCGVRWEKVGDNDFFAVGRGFRIPFQIEQGNPQGL